MIDPIEFLIINEAVSLLNFSISGKHTKLCFLDVIFVAESESAMFFFYHIRFIFQKSVKKSAVM